MKISYAPSLRENVVASLMPQPPFRPTFPVDSTPESPHALRSRCYELIDTYHQIPEISPCALMRSATLAANWQMHPDHIQRGLEVALLRGRSELATLLAHALKLLRVEQTEESAIPRIR